MTTDMDKVLFANRARFEAMGLVYTRKQHQARCLWNEIDARRQDALGDRDAARRERRMAALAARGDRVFELMDIADAQSRGDVPYADRVFRGCAG